jgi:hypothetical protein
MRYLIPPRILKTEDGTRYYETVVPENPTQQQFGFVHIARVGDRWDTIAYKYLRNASLWYLVANANGGLNGSIFIKPGTRILIPEL